MEEPKRLPISLIVVAVFFMLGGSYCLFNTIIALMHRQVDIPFMVLNLIIGVGLLRLNRGWQTVALVVLWFWIVFIPLMVLAPMVGWSAVELAFWAIAYILISWSYHVLTRPHVRKLFGICDPRPEE